MRENNILSAHLLRRFWMSRRTVIVTIVHCTVVVSNAFLLAPCHTRAAVTLSNKVPSSGPSFAFGVMSDSLQEASPTVDFQSMTVPQLKEQLRERGLKVSGKKGDLVERLRDHGGTTQVGEPQQQSKLEEQDAAAKQHDHHQLSPTSDFKSMTVVQLKEQLRERGLKVSGGKSELVERLIDYEKTQVEEETLTLEEEPKRTQQEEEKEEDQQQQQQQLGQSLLLPLQTDVPPWRKQPFKKRPEYDALFEQSKQLNQKIVKCETAKDVLNLLASTKGALTSTAGGGKLNSVNFSTAIHRLARHMSSWSSQRSDRLSTLSDARFAMFLCSLAEALGGLEHDNNEGRGRKVIFRSRNLANVAWAIAKIKIAPPQTALKLQVSDDAQKDLLETAREVRNTIMEVAKAKQQQGGNGSTDSNLWVPTLSILCGHILDTISYRALQEGTRYYKSREMANLLWALATARRAEIGVFDSIAQSLVEDTQRKLYKQQKYQKDNDEQNEQQEPMQEQPPRDILWPQEWSNSVWAFATAQITGQGQEQVILFVANMLDTQEGFIDKFDQQGLSNTAWGVATLLSSKMEKRGENQEEDTTTANGPQQQVLQDAALRIFRHIARSLIQRADEFQSQGISNTVWAFATLGFGVSSTSSLDNNKDDPIILPTMDLRGDEDLMIQAVDAAVKSALPRLSKFGAQELNNLAWSLAKLGLRGSTWDDILEGIGTELASPRRRVGSRDISVVLWSLATLNYDNKMIYRGIASRLASERGQQCKPQELSNSVWALATADMSPLNTDAFDTTLVRPSERLIYPMETDPIGVCFGMAADELMRRPHEFKPQEIKDILWSFSKAGLRHPDLFRAAAVHLVGPESFDEGVKQKTPRGLDAFSPQGVGNTAWAYARQSQLAEAVGDRIDSSAIAASNTGRLLGYTASYLDIGEITLKKLFVAIAETDLLVHDNLSKLNPTELSTTVWAFAILGLRHTKFTEAAKAQLLDRIRDFIRGSVTPMTSFQGHEFANLLWAFATLNCPFSDILNEIAPYMQKVCSNDDGEVNTMNIARAFTRQELATIAWSAAVFGEYPRHTMHLLYSGLVGMASKDQVSDPQFLRDCYEDGGLPKNAVMALIYNQLAMEMEDPENGLGLPEDFPEGWDAESHESSSSSGRRSSLELTDISFGIDFSAGMIQNAVSRAFNRIGFDHVEGHVLSVMDLIQDYGINLSISNSLEILSIDVASASNKVDMATWSNKIGIEVCGPAHYICLIDELPAEGGQVRSINKKTEYEFNWDGSLQDINGPTALKQRLLKCLGWKVIHLPFWEWQDLRGDEALQEDHCRSLLDKHM